MVAELQRFLDILESDEGARVVIVRAEGKAFCAGLDLKEERERDGGESELDRAARSLAESMLKSTPLALGLTKECLGHNAFTDSLEQAIAMEDRNQILASQDADFFEAVKAFMERRPPRFGRGQ